MANERGKVLFSVYVIHSLPTLMSVVQLFVGNRMAVVAHLVGEDTVGDREQLERTFHFSVRSKTENQVNELICYWFIQPGAIPKHSRVMIIKDNDGDVGLALAFWTGVKPGIKGIKSTLRV